MVRLREQAEAILRDHPQSFEAHFLLAWALHYGEGDLPRARYHLERARKLHGARYHPPEDPSWTWMQRILMEQMVVLGEMDLYEEQIQVLDELNDLYRRLSGGSPDAFVVEYAWPLMKLRREQEARRRIRLALTYPDEWNRTSAWNALGALEMELDHPRESYEAFQRLLAEVRQQGWAMTCTYLRNAGEAAVALGRFEEGEQLFSEATRYFQSETYSNPWWDLAGLYLAQARFTEAAEALKNMHLWSKAVRPYLAQQSWADNQQMTGQVLLELGYVEEALRILKRIVSRPDRRGGTSGTRDQAEAGNLMAYRAALRARRETLAEEMSWLRGRRWWIAWWKRLRLGLEERVVARRVAALAVSHGRVKSSLRFYHAGTVLFAHWYRPDLVRLYGPGVCRAALRSLAADPPATYDLERPYLALIEAEIEAVCGNRRGARERLEWALANLPAAEAMLRARATTRLAQMTGDPEDYQRVLETAPSMIRALGAAVPVRLEGAPDPALRRAARMIRKSPRFRERSDGLRLRLSSDGVRVAATLFGKRGEVLAEARVPVTKDARQTAADLVARFHRRAFSPRVDLTQEDLNSLDGSNLSGSPATERLKELFGPRT